MKAITFILLTINIALAYGQNFSYPTLRSNSFSISNFIPTGWTVLDSAFGDLNNDKLDDIAFVLQQLKDSGTFIKYEDHYNANYYNYDTIITQHRILVIVFYNSTTKQYDLVEQNNSFILNHDNPIMDEPFKDISINNEVLKIDFYIWYNSGSWSMSNNSYKFRYKDKQFKLIGADYSSVDRRSGETEDRSYNFLTKKVKVETSNISNNTKKTYWKTLDIKELKTMQTFKQPFTWEVEKGFYL